MKSNQNLGMAGISIVFHDTPTAQRRREKGLYACTVTQVGNDASIDTPFATPRRHGEEPECLPESETSEATSSGTSKPDIPSPNSTEPTNKPQSTAASDTKIKTKPKLVPPGTAGRASSVQSAARSSTSPLTNLAAVGLPAQNGASTKESRTATEIDSDPIVSPIAAPELRKALRAESNILGRPAVAPSHIICDYCQKEITKDEFFQDHRKECKAEKPCSHCNERVRVENMSGHVRYHCKVKNKAVPKKCRWCLEYVEDMKEHKGGCSKWLIECQLCNKHVPRDQHDAHLAECKAKKRVQKCKNCNEHVSDIKVHLEECPKAPIVTCMHCGEIENKHRFWGSKQHVKFRCRNAPEQKVTPEA